MDMTFSTWLRNKTGGGLRDKSDGRHYDPKVQFLLLKSFIYSFNISKLVFIVAVFINTNK